jgi:hypothetical protein
MVVVGSKEDRGRAEPRRFPFLLPGSYLRNTDGRGSYLPRRAPPAPPSPADHHSAALQTHPSHYRRTSTCNSEHLGVHRSSHYRVHYISPTRRGRSLGPQGCQRSCVHQSVSRRLVAQVSVWTFSIHKPTQLLDLETSAPPPPPRAEEADLPVHACGSQASADTQAGSPDGGRNAAACCTVPATQISHHRCVSPRFVGPEPGLQQQGYRSDRIGDVMELNLTSIDLYTN